MPCWYSPADSSNMPLEWLFGRKMTPEEMLRKNQRALNKAMRDLDRERSKMEQQEKKIIADIKKMAKMGQMVRLGLAVMIRSYQWLSSAELQFSEMHFARSVMFQTQGLIH